MSDLRISKKEKNQHIQVFVRVRPINITEKTSKSITLVDVVSSKEIIIRERPQDKLSKKFTFDKVFGPTCKQVDVYNAVVSPLLDEVLAGYNCTVFAYGQTGTGKTFTMEGLSNDRALHWQSDSTAGIIPRALSHLFDELRTLDSQEYTVRVSFLELYNEELFDLLSPNDDASKIRLYEDASRKGAVIIHGLEEVTVHNKSEVYKILEKGSEKRQTAATMMNAHSSRSHTVFSITIHIKENTVDGEELLKTGKLNLVDLAGSENVGRSGAVDRRAREAGNINQSLLTLGRVITALVERAPHIPYRESKLTRLLQESLGGRTKTSIIATVSPESINLEETLSTLDYAHRAKNITNRPEINQKLSKKTLLKEYTEEIERLRRDLLATRERNGVYVAHDNFNEMQALLECQSKEIEEKNNHMKALEETMRKKEELFNSLQSMYHAQVNALNKTRSALESAEVTLKSTKSRLDETERERDEQKYLVEKHVSTEVILSSQAQVLLKVADTASSDVYGLHEKINRKKQVEAENENLGQQFRGDIANRVEDIEKDFSVHTQKLIQFCLTMKDQIGAQTSILSKAIDTTIHHISKDLVKQVCTVSDKLTECANRSFDQHQSWGNRHVQDISCASEHESNELSNISKIQTAKIRELVENKIAENLRSLNMEISQKLEHLSTNLKDSTDCICHALCVDRDHLLKDIVEIKESVQTIYQERNQIFEEKQNFAKAVKEMYNQFNKLNEIEDKGYCNISASLNRVNEVCDNLSDTAITSCNEASKKERSVAENIQNDVKIITDKITSGIGENVVITERTIEQGNIIADELQTGLSSSCKAWIKCKNLVECNVEHLQQDSKKEKSAILSSTQGLRKIMSDASVNHMEFMEDQRNKTESITTELSRKCEQQSVESAEWNNKVTAELRTVHHQIEKFLAEDLRRDISTGYTPIKKEFQYPRQLVATSPHERIIQRFREARQYSNTIENEDVSVRNGDSTLKADISCTDTDASCNINITSTPNRNVHSTSTPITELKSKRSTCNESVSNLIKAASTSDLSIVTRPLDLSVHSESEICLQSDNKENLDDEVLLKSQGTKSRQFTGWKTTKRSALGTYN